MAEDPDAEKKRLHTEMAYHYSKIPEDAKPFSQKARNLKYGTFNNPEKVYGGPSLALTRNMARSQKDLSEVHDK